MLKYLNEVKIQLLEQKLEQAKIIKKKFNGNLSLEDSLKSMELNKNIILKGRDIKNLIKTFEFNIANYQELKVLNDLILEFSIVDISFRNDFKSKMNEKLIELRKKLKLLNDSNNNHIESEILDLEIEELSAFLQNGK
jgi:hypothetical protein